MGVGHDVEEYDLHLLLYSIQNVQFLTKKNGVQWDNKVWVRGLDLWLVNGHITHHHSASLGWFSAALSSNPTQYSCKDLHLLSTLGCNII